MVSPPGIGRNGKSGTGADEVPLLRVLLEGEIRRCSALCEGRIGREVLKEEIQTFSATRPPVPVLSGGKTFKDIVREETERVERELVLQALRNASWVKSEASRLPGVSRPTLDEKIRLYNLDKKKPA